MPESSIRSSDKNERMFTICTWLTYEKLKISMVSNTTYNRKLRSLQKLSSLTIKFLQLMAVWLTPVPLHTCVLMNSHMCKRINSELPGHTAIILT